MELILESKQPSKRPKKDTIGHKCMKLLDNMLKRAKIAKNEENQIEMNN